MTSNKITLRLTSYDNVLLDQTVIKIVNLIEKSGAQVIGPIPLPTKKEIVTVIRSPHKHKDSREQFELRIYKRFLDIYTPNMKLLNEIQLPAGIKVQIKV